MTNKDQPLDADDLSSTIPQAGVVMDDLENSTSEDREDVPQMFARYRREISNQLDALQSIPRNHLKHCSGRSRICL